MHVKSVCHVEAIGRSLSPLFMVDSSDPEGYSILKYLPGAKSSSVEDMVQDDTIGSLEWQSLVARYMQMKQTVILNLPPEPVHFMDEDDFAFLAGNHFE